MEINSELFTEFTDVVKNYIDWSHDIENNELKLRKIFVENFLSAINEIDLCDDNIELLETFFKNVTSYKILLSDLHKDIGNGDIANILNIIQIYNETAKTSNEVSSIHDLIYRTMLNDTSNETIIDLVNKIVSDKPTDIAIYISPKINFSYAVQSESFSTLMDAMVDIYGKSFVFTDSNITDEYVSKLTNIIKESFENKNFILTNITGERLYKDELVFIKQFRYNEDWSLRDIFINNCYKDDIQTILESLTNDIYPIYMRQSERLYSNLGTVMSGFIDNIPKDTELTIRNFKYELFKSLLSQSTTDIANVTNRIHKFCKSISILKEKIKSIYNTYIATGKYILEV